MKNTFCYEAVRTRLELVTPCVTGMYSNQTELTHHYEKERKTRLDAKKTLSSFYSSERKTRLELATPTLARLCSTN